MNAVCFIWKYPRYKGLWGFLTPGTFASSSWYQGTSPDPLLCFVSSEFHGNPDIRAVYVHHPSLSTSFCWLHFFFPKKKRRPQVRKRK